MRQSLDAVLTSADLSLAALLQLLRDESPEFEANPRRHGGRRGVAVNGVSHVEFPGAKHSGGWILGEGADLDEVVGSTLWPHQVPARTRFVLQSVGLDPLGTPI